MKEEPHDLKTAHTHFTLKINSCCSLSVSISSIAWPEQESRQYHRTSNCFLHILIQVPNFWQEKVQKIFALNQQSLVCIIINVNNCCFLLVYGFIYNQMVITHFIWFLTWKMAWEKFTLVVSYTNFTMIRLTNVTVWFDFQAHRILLKSDWMKLKNVVIRKPEAWLALTCVQ